MTYDGSKPSSAAPAKIINNGDNHISSLGNSFLEAINKTSKSSGVNVDVGIDIAKSSGIVLYLQNLNYFLVFHLKHLIMLSHFVLICLNKTCFLQ